MHRYFKIQMGSVHRPTFSCHKYVSIECLLCAPIVLQSLPVLQQAAPGDAVIVPRTPEPAVAAGSPL